LGFFQQLQNTSGPWEEGEPQTFTWANFFSPVIRSGLIKISLLNNDISGLSNEVEVTVSNSLTISATADLS
jgi:hypothetical protein